MDYWHTKAYLSLTFLEEKKISVRLSSSKQKATNKQTSFSGVLGYIVPRLNGQSDISAGDFDIFWTNFSYLIIGVGQTETNITNL